MEEHQDTQFDSLFEQARCRSGLAWYPWVGKHYAAASPRILVIGESHYENKIEKLQQWQDAKSTRQCIVESCVNEEWSNRTWSNMTYALVGTTVFNKCGLWEHIAYYNFVQRLMDYATQQERPNGNDFIQGWKSFISVVRTLKPDYCIFVGVSAANWFYYMMSELGVEFSPVELLSPINRTRPRKAQVVVDGKNIPLLFMRHSGRYFTWSLWHKLLQSELPEAAQTLSEWSKVAD